LSSSPGGTPFGAREDRRLTRIGATALIAAALACVVVFFPPEGRVLAPAHAAIEALLGQASFVLPLGLVFVGVMVLVHQRRPGLRLPTQRLLGVGLLTIAVFPSERLLGGTTGLVGEWLTGFLIDVIGGPLTAVLLLVLVAAGAALVLDVRFRGQARAPG
jgi:hypothetical protein